MLKKVFGRVLKELREESNLSQEKLAELADLDRTYISLLERGLRQPSLNTIFNLSKALGVSPNQLILKFEKKQTK